MLSLVLRTCALVLLLAAGGGVAAGTVAVVTLKARADVPRKEIRLGDVAEVALDDEEGADLLRRAEVGRVDAVAGVTRLSRAALARQLEKHQPAGVLRIEWRGADMVQATLASARLDAAQVVAAAESALRQELELSHGDVQLQPVSGPDAVRVPPGPTTLKARVAPGAAAQPQRRMRVEVDVRSEGRLVGVVPVWFDVHAQAARWVLRRDLPAGHVLQAEDLERRDVDVAGVSASPEDPTGQRLRRAVRAGSVLPASAVEDLPWVSRQDEVTVEVRSGSVIVESRGIALADGRAGDWVAVRIPGAELLRGRVIGPKRLAI